MDASARRRTALVTAIALGAIAVGFWAAALRAGGPSMNTSTAAAAIAASADGVVVEPLPGAASEFLAGDVITAIGGRTLEAWAAGLLDPAAPRLAVATGDELAISVTRDGHAIERVVRLTDFPLLGVLGAHAGTLVFALVFAAVGGYVFVRRPHDPATIGLFLASVGSMASTGPFVLGLQPLDLATGTIVVSASALLGVYLLLYAGAVQYALTFPRPIGPFGRRPWLLLAVYAAVYGSFLATAIGGALAATTALAAAGAVLSAQYVPIIGSFAVMGLATVAQWRRAGPDDRRLLRGVAAAGLVTIGASLAIWFVPELVLGRPLVPWTVAGLVGIPVPLALAAAILRYRAFDIDVVVRRSVVYGSLTLSIALVYAVTVAGFRALLGGAEFAAQLLATGASALVALPLRDALQRGASRYLFGDRDDPARALATFGERLEWTIDPVEIPSVVVRMIAESLHLPYVALRVGRPGGSRVVAEHGASGSGETMALTLVYAGESVGELVVAPRSLDDPFSDADLRLLTAFARQAGPAVHAVGLTVALIDSRERLVAASEEERRRIRRDLHDGLGPTLAAIGMRAETAAALGPTDPLAAERELAKLRAEVGGALAEIRRLVDALRPPALDELGLVGAIRQQAERLGPTPRVTVEATAEHGSLPAAVEVAAYRIAVEAVTNAVRHSGAQACVVRIGGRPGAELTVDVADDGRGIEPEAQPGIGLTSMRERAAEVGGIVHVERASRGTHVVARLPIGSH
ncbi:MAG TPA: sensor histidine kinase [Candidatus Limnocylindrales bacterium]|nr:sensor histidine kinase [Candidatus Limnocylindrales bacterium]